MSKVSGDIFEFEPGEFTNTSEVGVSVERVRFEFNDWHYRGFLSVELLATYRGRSVEYVGPFIGKFDRNKLLKDREVVVFTNIAGGKRAKRRAGAIKLKPNTEWEVWLDERLEKMSPAPY